MRRTRSLLAYVGGALVGVSKAQGNTSIGSSANANPSSATVLPTSVPAPDINSSVYDLSQHFCRLWRHASVLVDRKIYIDGGNTYVPNNGGTFSNTASSSWTRGMNNHLLVLDLSQNFTSQDSAPYRWIHKSPDVPRALIEHALWYSPTTQMVYQLGGWFSANNNQDPGFIKTDDIPPSAVWQFDPASERWSPTEGSFELKHTGEKVERPGAAAYCDAPSLNRSFIFNGYVQQRSDRAYASYKTNSEFKFLGGMLELDSAPSLSKPKLTNISVPLSLTGDKTPFGPRMNGAMVHVPIGLKGILVLIGGQVTVSPTPYGTRVPDANAKRGNIQLGLVDIYDIESGFWFRQQTFGVPEIPSGRSDMCLVMVPANDQSSFSIYMVAGLSSYNDGSAIEEIWILTLPSFIWVLVHSRRSDGLYGHTCHAVGENLVVVGGMQANGGESKACANHMPAEIYSLVSQDYTSKFDAAGASRLPPVPAAVVSVIGGTASGGASVRSPKIWDDLYLQYIFNPSVQRPPYSPTYTLADGFSPTGDNKTGGAPPVGGGGGSNLDVIVGSAVGGAVGSVMLVALAAGLFIHIRRKRRRQEPPGAVLVYSDQSLSPAHADAKTMDYGRSMRRQQRSSVSVPRYHSAGPVEMPTRREPSELQASPVLSRAATWSAAHRSMDLGPLRPRSLSMSKAANDGHGGQRAVSNTGPDLSSWRDLQDRDRRGRPRRLSRVNPSPGSKLVTGEKPARYPGL